MIDKLAIIGLTILKEIMVHSWYPPPPSLSDEERGQGTFFFFLNTNQYFTLVVIMVYQVCFKIGEFLYKL